jgi:anti-sigma factor RsiW
LSPALHTGNLLRYLFTEPAARDLHRDWRATASAAVAALHRYAAHHPHDPALLDLAGELSVADPDFRRWWATPPAPHRPLFHHFRHPLIGDVTLAEQILTLDSEPDQFLHLLVADPDSPDEAALRLLATLTTS